MLVITKGMQLTGNSFWFWSQKSQCNKWKETPKNKKPFISEFPKIKETTKFGPH